MSKDEIIKTISEHPNYSKEKIFRNHFTNEYSDICSAYSEDISFKQKLYHWLHNDHDMKLGLCETCGERTVFRSLSFGYYRFCSSKCAQHSEDTRKKIEQTNLEKYGNTCSLNGKSSIEKKKSTWLDKYGVDNPSKSAKIQEKIKNTNLEKYGAKRPMQNSDIQEKMLKTNKSKYGCDYSMQNDAIKEKSKETCISKYGVSTYSQTNICKEQVKKTVLEHYGVEHPMQNDKIKEKTKKTCFDKYGVEYAAQDKGIREKIKDTNLERYGTEWTFSSEIVKEKIKNTNLERYGVPYNCMRKEARNHTNDSKPNREFAKLLDENNIAYEREFHIENYSYDFKIGDILIEINPTITHNCHIDIFGDKPKDKDYHLNKSNCASEHNCNCIHIWDWDDKGKIINMLKPKETLYARNLELREVSEKECDEFLNLYHLQNTCKGQKIRYGLYKDETLVQVMTFDKPRYNKKHELELLRLCSNKDYNIVGGAEKIFKYILDKFKPENIISYCDRSKFDGEVYRRLGFSLKSNPSTSKHWYRKKDKKHITDNLLRLRGFDQIFGTDYGNGTSNEELMIQYGFLPVYDCGQMTFIFSIQNFNDSKE